MAQPQLVPYITAEEYLTGEELSVEKHEYVDGQVFMMAGATDAHNVIAGNAFAYLHGFLRGTGCRAYINDMKAQVKAINAFYYPDVMVSCGPRSPKDVYTDTPVLIIEVISPSTETIDRREKLFNYRKISTLREYVLIDQNERCVERYHLSQAGEWIHEILRDEGELVLTSLHNGECKIPFDELYEGVEFEEARMQ